MRSLMLLVSMVALSGALILPNLVEQEAAATTADDVERGCQDDDGDGFGLGCASGVDCNDLDPGIHPNQPEICNFRDDDCNGLVDDAPSCTAPPLDASRVPVPAGAFTMGSADRAAAADEAPAHEVVLSAFAIDRHEVTNRRFRACVKAGRCQPPALASSSRRPEYYGDPRFDDYPVIFVSWEQAREFCRWAGGRLPTEAEWEKAARGTGHRVYPWGGAAPDCRLANMGGAKSCVGDTDRVGRRLAGASPYGALDMAGNVWEWVADWYDAGYYRRSPRVSPRGPARGSLRVMRGGCWVSGASTLRVSCRKAELPGSWAPNVGFRCAYDRKGR